jgi:hypothetical protein
MYSLDQLRAAIRNAKVAGDEQAVQALSRAASQIAMQQAPDESYDPSEGGGTFRVGLGVGSVDTGLETPQWLDRTLAGTGRGISNVARHAGNLVGAVSDEDLAAAKTRDKPLMNTTAGTIGNLIGEAAVTAPLAMGATMGVAKLGAGAANALANPIVRGGFEGALQGGLMADPGDKTGGLITGGALGAALPAAFKGGKALVGGLKRTPEAQSLLNAGVDLTPGQMNPGGMLNQAEEAWQSVPGVGSVIKGARDNAQQSFQRAAIQEGAAPGTQIASGEAADMLDAAYQSFQPLYDQAKGFPVFAKIVNTSGPDIPLATAFDRAANNAGVRATDETRKSVGAWLRNQITQGVRSSDDLLAMRSAIRAEARNASAQGDAAARALLDQANDAVTKAVESQLPKQALSALKTADAKYGIYKTLEDAVARAKDMPGGFTASKLSEAVAQNSGKGMLKGAYARGGGGALRGLSSAGTATMNVRSPATGARLAAIGIPSAIGMANPAFGIPAGAAMLGMVGTQTGRKLAAGATKPQMIAQALLAAGRNRISDPTAEIMAEYLRRASVALPRE